jgi:hypothetical protein
MVEACSHAVFEGRCALALDTSSDTKFAPSPTAPGDDAEAGADADSQAVAIVTWNDVDHRVARVEVGLRRATRGEWLARTIEFTRGDAPRERWVAVGLVIATLVGQTLHVEPPAAPPAPPPPPPAPPSHVEAPPSPAVPPGHDKAWVDGEALLAPGLDSGAARTGGSLRFAWAPLRAPLFASAGGGYAWTAREPSSGVAPSWATLAAGAGAVLSVAAGLRFDVRLEALAQLLSVSAVGAGGAADQGSRWVGGARVGVDAAWLPLRYLGVVASAEGSLLGGSTDITIGGLRAARDAANAAGFAGLLGLRAAIP